MTTNNPGGTGRGSTAPSRREQILSAAAELFARYGFHGVGIDDIGAAVGISGPALYRHFRSKDAMLGEMLTGISERLLHGGRARTVNAGDPLTALEALVAWHVEFALTNSALITVHLRDLDSLTEPDRHRVRELQRGYVEVWVDTLRRCRPGTGEHTARASAHAVLGLINSTPHSALLDTTRMSELLHRMAMNALLADHEDGHDTR
ncbi:TetR/AcrR family transcriptional regulator [Actinopolyspora erythraea]|uniref:TetR family transcriptional regulator n=1 Tax=Actinopolyspora erythraea TaxID=414996 RepID=A0A099D9J1_9ACTN|nr:TetR/AcrR family transcriptional regulator [Actinopolyspora erythraea]ASU80367.1 TetR/AcrR family transcriptional regulator [Actinopolyspora erythraea]KGI82551.1 TetR family transcriptional regulator [Actinopolyspora erythraea]